MTTDTLSQDAIQASMDRTQADQIDQYTLWQILGIVALVTLPMGLLAWVVAPALIPYSPLHPGITYWLLMIAGMAWQFVVSLVIVNRELGTLRWSAIRKRTWLQTPRHPKTDRPDRRLYWWVLPLVLINALAGFILADFLDAPWIRLFPALQPAPFMDIEQLASPEFQGQWWLLGVALVSFIFNYFLGEEFLFRGVLLPKMQGVFGKYDWVANAVLFGFYHLHRIWALPSIIVSNLTYSWPARRFRSSWMAILVHGSELLLPLVMVLAVILGPLPSQGGELYEDPQGRFTMQVGNWEQVETDGPYAQFELADPPMNMYVLVLEAGTIDDAFTQALETVGFDPGLLIGGAFASFDAWQAYIQEDTAGLSHGLAGQIVGENAYVAVVKADKPGVGVENAAVMRALTSLKVTGQEEIVIASYADLEAFVQDRVEGLAGSVSIAVLHQDEIVYTYVYGQANPLEGLAADAQTIYRFGSMTKPFTASALMQLVEQGRVDLDAWPGEYIPEFPQRWNVTVRQLLSHAACMPDNQRLTLGLIAKRGESFAPLGEIFTNYVKDNTDLLCEPGKESQYANAHFLALARIIEEVSGEAYDTYVVDHILTPLKMKSTHFQIVEPGERYAKGQFPAAQTGKLVAQLNEYLGPGQEDLILQKGESFSTMDDFRPLAPWGGLLGTPSDVTHFLQMHMNDGRYGDIQILQPETVAAMQEMQTSTDGSPLGFGLSWWIGGNDIGEFYYHGGGGATIETTMRFYPDLDLGVVVIGSVNGYQAERIADGLVSAWTHAK